VLDFAGNSFSAWIKNTGAAHYGQTEIRMVDGENNIDIMRRKAKELLKASHPHTRMVDYVWAGAEKGWLDREAATAAGL